VERSNLLTQQRQNEAQRRALENQGTTSRSRSKPVRAKPAAKPCDCPPGDPLCSCL
jgi:hypothetical protein